MEGRWLHDQSYIDDYILFWRAAPRELAFHLLRLAPTAHTAQPWLGRGARRPAAHCTALHCTALYSQVRAASA